MPALLLDIPLLKMLFKKCLKILGIAILLCFIAILVCDIFVKLSAKDRLYENIDLLPANKVGLLLGTSKYRKDGSNNPFFDNRIEAAAQLYKLGKIKLIIASGNKSGGYDEPKTMRLELIKKGVPDSVIYADNFGFRTMDSILRCKKVFNQDDFTIISQKFHNERAIFIAKQHGISAIAYNAQAVVLTDSLKTRGREYLARVRAVLDLFLIEDGYLLDVEIIHID